MRYDHATISHCLFIRNKFFLSTHNLFYKEVKMLNICWYCPGGYDKRLHIFEFGGVNVSQNLKPAYREHVAFSPVQHVLEIVELPNDEILNLFLAGKALAHYYGSSAYVLFWFKGIGRHAEHAHVHGMTLMPSGFGTLPETDLHIEFKANLWTDEGEKELLSLPESVKELAKSSKAKDYTMLLTGKRLRLFIREPDDHLFGRNDPEHEFALRAEADGKPYEWAEELRSKFAHIFSGGIC